MTDIAPNATPERAQRLADAIAAYRASPETVEAYKRTMKAYLADPRDKANGEALLQAGEAYEALVDPIDDVLSTAFAAALKAASNSSALRPTEGIPGNTIFEERWSELLGKGWENLAEFEKEDMCGALGRSIRLHQIEKANPEVSAGAIANSVLTEIARGSLSGPVPGETLFKNFADGSRLHFTLENWTPSVFGLNEAGESISPIQYPNGVIFHLPVEFPSGKLLVADMVDVGTLNTTKINLISALGIHINYAWPRVLKTLAASRILGTIDVCLSESADLYLETATGRLHLSRPGAGMRLKATITGAYRGVTIVDRAQAKSLLVDSGMTEKEAEQAITRWLEASDWHTEVTVSPGTWHLYWDFDRETLAGSLSAEGQMPRGCELTLAPTEMSFDIPVKHLAPVADRFGDL